MGGMYLDPTLDPDAFDTVVFNDTLRTPGKCKVTGWDRPVEYDHKKGKGTAGAEQTLKGLPPAKGKIEFESWTPEQRQAWSPILDALKFDQTKLGTGAPAAASSNALTSTPQGPSGLATSSTSGFAGASASSSGSTNVFALPAAGQQESAFTGGAPAASSTASQPSPLSSAFAIAIFYPTLSDIDVHFVLPPEKLGIWEPVGDDYSHMKRTIDFVEYTGQPPNKSISATPTGSVDPASATSSPGAAPAAGSPGEPAAASSSASQSTAAGADAQGAWGAS